MSSPTNTSPTPLARSPITPVPPVSVQAGWTVGTPTSTGEMTLSDLAPVAKLQVKAPWNGAAADVLRVPMGRAARDADNACLVVGSSPGEWLVLGGVGRGAELGQRLQRDLAAAATDELVTIIDLTHGRALLRLTGDKAAAVLAKVCAVDFGEPLAPNGAAFRSSVARLVTDVVRDDHDQVPSYLLHCERSSGQYLFDALADAGAEFGLDIGGCTSPGI